MILFLNVTLHGVVLNIFPNRRSKRSPPGRGRDILDVRQSRFEDRLQS